MNKKLCVVLSKFAIAVTIAASVSVPVYAADGDIYNKASENLGSIGNILLRHKSELFTMIRSMNTYKYEVGGKMYDASDVNDKFNSLPGSAIGIVHSNIKASLTPTGDVQEAVPDGFAVKSIE
ncbi:hypothetical protein K9O30_01865 [Clostridium bowmanii]|uniref:hypothetical protein n=1 Tax=Clostridium bowmanii TaxID=132925 RepID=UPI001C0B7576|nr:hypothetical protein [Clostridium bowmanii]MBU3190283.1 hypothetical protein [Clostridium bowmanii]MCA1072505.1 hypothetical protein [Clostridium bowmanii]